MEENVLPVQAEESVNNSEYFDMTKGLFRAWRDYTKHLAHLQLDNPNSNGRTLWSINKYTRRNIIEWLKSPEANAKNLRDASIYLYEVSTQYRRLITHFSTLITLDYVVSPYKLNPSKVDLERFKSLYYRASDYIQTFNLKHEIPRILTVAYREDVYYGYLLHDKDTCHIMKLNPDYCKITSVLDSTFIYSFNFGYFDEDKEALTTYPEEFRIRYDNWKNPTSTETKAPQWQELDTKNQFCIKVTDSIYPTPMLPFSGVLEYIYRILDYADLQQEREELENYKIIGLQLPTNDQGQLSIDRKLAEDFYNNLCNVLPSSVGAFMAPCKFEDISFERSNAADSDLTNSATVDFWNATGVSSLLFGGEQTAASLAISNKSDIAMAMYTIRQVERVINRLMKENLKGTIRFQINILPVSIYNQKEMSELYLKNAQYGLPTKMMAATVCGQTPNEIVGMTYLENEMLNLSETWKPLQSSHTSVQEEDRGRPASADDETISDAADKAHEYQ